MNNSNFSKFAAIIFARYNSSRLPGKVLFTIGETTILGICVNKLKTISELNVIVATSDQKTDDPIAEWCLQHSIPVFRGSLTNVAGRTSACLDAFPCEAFFRINADSPFLQPDLLTRAKDLYNANPQTDIVSNVIERSYPYGIAVELIKAITFQKEVVNFKGDETEHITSYFYRRAEDFSIASIKNEQDLSHLKFVLDTPEDWNHIRKLYEQAPGIFTYTLSELIKINTV